MSICALSSKREFIAPEASDLIKSKWSRTASSKSLDISQDCFFRVFAFLHPEEVALFERVSRAWQKTINEKNQAVWKQQYLNFFPEANSPLGEVSRRIYKKLLVPIYGNVSFPPHAAIFSLVLKKELVYEMEISLSKLDLVTVKREPFSIVKPAPVEGVSFTETVSLRCFINPEDNSYKKTGDKIKSLWSGRRLVLTCSNKNNFLFNSFDRRIASDVPSTILMGRVTQEDVDAARALAKAAGEWVHLN